MSFVSASSRKAELFAWNASLDARLHRMDEPLVRRAPLELELCPCHGQVAVAVAERTGSMGPDC